MKNKQLYLYILTILIVTLSSFIFYRLFTRDHMTSVYTYTLDRETTFELVRLEEVTIIRVSTVTPGGEHTVFKVPDVDSFIETYVINHEYFVMKLSLSYEINDMTLNVDYYLFEYKNQLFALHVLNETSLRLEHIGAHIDGMYIPFPVYDELYHKYSDGEKLLWENIDWEPWHSFEDAAIFYERLSSETVLIDYENKVIKLNGLIYSQMKVQGQSINYPVTLTFDEDGFLVEINEILD